MAALAITTVSVYPFEDTTYYLYCDRCGSFCVGTFISAPTRVGLLVALLSGAILWHHIGKSFAAAVQLILWWATFLFPAAAVLYGASVYHGHKCWNCGNTRISNEDVLQYGSQGARPYDVPYERLHKHDTLHDKCYKELPQMLLIILFGLFVLPMVTIVTIIVGMLALGVADAYSILKSAAKRSLAR
jgi:hypothetical protein